MMICYADTSQLIYRTEPTTKKWKTKKVKKTDMLRSIGKQSAGNPWSQSDEEKEGYGGKDLQERKVLSLE